MDQLKGLSAFPVTPTDGEGRVDCEHLSRLVENLCRPGITSIGVLGSTGGYMYLSAEQRSRALSAAVEAAGTTPVLAGIGALTTHEVLEHVRHAETAGAGAALLAPVSYLPLTQDDVAGLFRDVARETELPLCFYNNPGTTGFAPTEELIADLANEGTIAAVKNPPAPGGDFQQQIGRLRAATSDNFVLGYSGDVAIAGALSAGADAWYSVLAGTLPGLAIAMWRARNDGAKLAELNDALAPLWETFNAYGSIRVIHEVTGMTGKPVALPAPLRPLDAVARGQIEKALALLESATRMVA